MNSYGYIPTKLFIEHPGEQIWSMGHSLPTPAPESCIQLAKQQKRCGRTCLFKAQHPSYKHYSAHSLSVTNQYHLRSYLTARENGTLMTNHLLSSFNSYFSREVDLVELLILNTSYCALVKTRNSIYKVP